jgi:hypothetical protein
MRPLLNFWRLRWPRRLQRSGAAIRATTPETAVKFVQLKKPVKGWGKYDTKGKRV